MPDKPKSRRQPPPKPAQPHRKHSERRLDESLKETFPASDASQETHPGGGITSVEPPPAGQKTGR